MSAELTNKGIKPRDFIEAVSLAIAFFTFALVIAVAMDIETVITNPVSIVNVPINIAYLVLILISLLLFVFFTISLFVRPFLSRISEFYKKAPFLQLIWITIIINFVASAIGSANQLSEAYRPVVIYILALWPVIVALALIANLIGYNWKRLERLRILGKYVRWSRSRISVRNEWLGTIVDNEMKSRNLPVSFFTRLGLKKPSWKTVLVIVCIFGVSVFISWVISVLAPGTFLISENKLKDYYLAMWQVQGAIAAFALPLLIVVVEFSKDQRHVAGKRPEALIRESWVFPIIVYALLGMVRLGIDISWFQNESVFVFDLVFILIGTI